MSADQNGFYKRTNHKIIHYDHLPLADGIFAEAVSSNSKDPVDQQAIFRVNLETCRDPNLAASLERSRSGQGGHIWFFFDEPIPAGLARKLGSHILTETMERRPDMGLDSYDRFFPNQDTLPKGGFGNLIALPLQKQPREWGNSVFLDDKFNPHPDQWAFLSTIRKISRNELEQKVHDAEGRGRIVGVRLALPDEDDDPPWMTSPSHRPKEPPIAGPVPKSLELVLGNQIYIAKDMLTPGLRNRLLRLAAFQNPEFYKAQAMRLPTYDKPRIIACAEDYPQHIGLPRGCLEEVRELLADLKITSLVRDERCKGQPLDVSFNGMLRPDQQVAANAMAGHDTGVLSAATAFGKTVIGAWLIAHRGVNTLILLHRRHLLEQWIDRLSAFLGLPVQAIGQIGEGRKKPTGSLDVAVIQSLVRKGAVDDRVGEYGYLVVDECHRLSAPSAGCSMLADCIACIIGSVKSAFMTMPTSMSLCLRGCSTGVAGDMRRSATRSCCRQAPYQAGRPTYRFLSIQSGKAIMLPASVGWFETVWTNLWQPCL